MKLSKRSVFATLTALAVGGLATIASATMGGPSRPDLKSAMSSASSAPAEESTEPTTATTAKKMTTAAPDGSWIRLFMVPGMQHCGGGEGPNTPFMTFLGSSSYGGTFAQPMMLQQTASNAI